MKVLAVGRARSGVDAPGEIAPRARAAMEVLWNLYRDGVARERYSPGGPGAVLVLETAIMQEAEEALARLPLVANNVIEFELVYLHPFRTLQTQTFTGSGHAGRGPIRYRLLAAWTGRWSCRGRWRCRVMAVSEPAGVR